MQEYASLEKLRMITA